MHGINLLSVLKDSARRPCSLWWLPLYFRKASTSIEKHTVCVSSHCLSTPFPRTCFSTGATADLMLLVKSGRHVSACVSLQDFKPAISSVQIALHLDLYIPSSFIPSGPLLRCSFPEKPSLENLCKVHPASHHPGCPYSLLLSLSFSLSLPLSFPPSIMVVNVSYYIPHFFNLSSISPTWARTYAWCVHSWGTNLRSHTFVLGDQSTCETT